MLFGTRPSTMHAIVASWSPDMHRCLAISVPLLALCAAAPVLAATTIQQVLPTVYEAGHFYAVPETSTGQQLTLFVDTGGPGAGGMYWINSATTKRLHLKTRPCGPHATGAVADIPTWRAGHGLPPPLPGPCGTAIMVHQRGAQFSSLAADGGLGAGYFPGRTWIFDYPAHRLSLEGAAWHPSAGAHATALGFPRDAQGHETSGFPRIVIHVDGQPINMLLDTGATAHPTPAGEAASHTPTVNGYGVTSYIVKSTFDRWRREHPDWRVVQNGDDLGGPGHTEPIIEVPKVEIAGWSVGPVWFTERADKKFTQMMSSMMDRTVYGSAGANLFRHFVMTIDYPAAKAYFRCVRGCVAAPTPPPAP